MQGLSKTSLIVGVFSLATLTYATDDTTHNIHRLTWRRAQILEFIKARLPENPVILEAGAFDGTDTVRMSKCWPQAHIHAFEPVPEAYEKLKMKTRLRHNVSTYPFALSDKKGFAMFYLSESPDKPGISAGSGSLLAPKEHLKYTDDVVFPNQTQVETLTIDQWAQENNIDHIDFMWLDMQGHELTALKNALTILPTVTLIYTEVEFVEAYEGQPLYKDIKEWLGQQGFEVIATDFDERHAALGEKIPVGKQWFGDAVFYKKP